MSGEARTRRGALSRSRDPRVLLGLVGATAVTVFALTTARKLPGPGPLTAVHASVPELEGGRACALCHGLEPSESAMAAACSTCHAAVGAALAEGSGFHGQLEAGTDCARCHKEHLGADFRPAGDAAFVAAGFDGVAGYDHRGLGFSLHGAHDGLACSACHPNAEADVLAAGVARFGGAAQTCTTCHADPHSGAFGATCADCHGQERPFAEAAAFAHTADFPLVGAHAAHACTTCHAAEGRYGIESYSDGDAPPRTCAECHASPHGAAFVGAARSSCATCHAPEGAAGEAVAFDVAGLDATRAAHGATGFALADAHAAVACEACHAAAGTFAERHPGRSATDCAACHTDAHSGQFTSDPARGCAECHAATAFADVPIDANAHAGLGWPLEGAHAALACDACHGAGEGAVYRGAPRSCAGCHEDVHAGRFEATPRGCAECHDTASFRGASDAFAHEVHTGFALEAAHTALACDACHAPVEGRRLGPAAASFLPGAAASDLAACVACHADPHDGRFDAVDVPRELDGRAGCARCHGGSTFREVPPERFDHGRWTGFALAGAHAQTRCTACHGGAREPLGAGSDGSPRLDAVAASFPAFDLAAAPGCASCHADPHAGSFDPHTPERVAGRVGCARCHGEASFRARRDFDHAWTGWSLEGLHAGASCAACHPTRADGRPGAPAGTACADCHVDPHAGQLASRATPHAPAATDCARCHGTDRPFADLDFDHDTSRFPLDAQHAKLDCAACHRPARTRDGRELVRYRPLGILCADCHGVSGRGGEEAR